MPASAVDEAKCEKVSDAPKAKEFEDEGLACRLECCLRAKTARLTQSQVTIQPLEKSEAKCMVYSR